MPRGTAKLTNKFLHFLTEIDAKRLVKVVFLKSPLTANCNGQKTPRLCSASAVIYHLNTDTYTKHGFLNQVSYPERTFKLG